jgi:hypothetical protein
MARLDRRRAGAERPRAGPMTQAMCERHLKSVLTRSPDRAPGPMLSRLKFQSHLFRPKAEPLPVVC